MSQSLPLAVREIAAEQVEVLAGLVAGLSDAELMAPTRCTGWLAAHLLGHCRLGLAEQAASFAEPAGPAETADRDYVSYWRDWPPSSEPPAYERVRFHWVTASAYRSGDSLRQHFADTARQAAGMSRQAAGGLFRLQGHVMAAEDILAMWTVEWVVHQLDLTVCLPGGRPAPADEALALTVQTLDGLAGLAGAHDRPADWDDAGYVVKATGRVPLSDTDREFLGERAAAFPVFG